MSEQGLTTRTIKPVRHLVYTRRAADGALPTDHSDDGWKLDEQLVCGQIVLRAGARVGDATFVLLPRLASQMRVEHTLNRYSIDDQVQVRTLPVDDELVAQPEAPAQSRVLFEGVLGRANFDVQTQGDQARETISFIAQPFPRLDNRSTSHMIVGRWGFDRRAATEANGNDPIIFDSHTLPAVFNFRSRPNCGRQKIAATMEGQLVVAPAFTHDDDGVGTYWTLKQALASTIITWLYGIEDWIDVDDGNQQNSTTFPSLDRHITLDTLLADELANDTDTPLDASLAAINTRLPEIDVHGMGVLDAIETLCNAAGFDMAVEPVAMDSEQDRHYQLRIWQKTKGRQTQFFLAPADSGYGSDVEAMFANNNIQSFVGMRDADAIINEIIGFGRTYFEGRFDLRPMWDPVSDLNADNVDDATLQSEEKDLLAGDGYHSKFVIGGKNFESFGHVGRVWGIDCVGQPFGTEAGGFIGYTVGDYAHPVQGFDFADALGLNDPGNDYLAARAALGATKPVRWSNRQRRALPLANATARKHGVDFILEVSEDNGANWNICPRNIFKTHRDQFAISLQPKNLARVNYASLSGDVQMCTYASSWWKLARWNQDLRFRLTCRVEADSGITYEALRRSSSASVYRRAQVLTLPTEEVWQAGSSKVPLLNPSEQPRKVIGWGSYSGEASPPAHATLSNEVKAVVDRRRDALEGTRITGTVGTSIMDFDRYQLGDAIAGINGRNISFSVNGGNAERFPNIVEIMITLAPAEAQAITYTIGDHAFARGGR